nr:MAG TPA: hypothetical protein [Caudoviricetes sp.]
MRNAYPVARTENLVRPVLGNAPLLTLPLIPFTFYKLDNGKCVLCIIVTVRSV